MPSLVRESGGEAFLRTVLDHPLKLRTIIGLGRVSSVNIRSHNINDVLIGISRILTNLTGIFDDREETEEEKQRRKADNAGVVLGLAEEQSTSDEDIDDGENEGFEITM